MKRYLSVVCLFLILMLCVGCDNSNSYAFKTLSGSTVNIEMGNSSTYVFDKISENEFCLPFRSSDVIPDSSDCLIYGKFISEEELDFYSTSARNQSSLNECNINGNDCLAYELSTDNGYKEVDCVIIVNNNLGVLIGSHLETVDYLLNALSLLTITVE